MRKNAEEVNNMFLHDNKRNIFKNFIEYIRFPHFKNFEENFRLTFTFPITFIIGSNGTGKSSLLHALYGCPKRYNIGKFWFNTELDPINDKQYLIYSYKAKNTKQNVEIIKQRINKTGNPDYWESARPSKKFGMSSLAEVGDIKEVKQTRCKLLKKNVLYSDFRYELSAFDKFFYFGSNPGGKNIKTKKDLIRYYSPKLKEAFDINKATSYNKRKTNKPEILSKEEISIVSHILGKEYKEIKIIKHNYFAKIKGFSVLYSTNNSYKYSEAFAGSGETAIIKLVHDIYNVKEYSLVLLDEPETSLHPEAQKRLIEFILQQVKIKKIQVVVSTHSPDLIEDMPPESIKVLYSDLDTGKIKLVENIIPEEAFYHIGHSVSNKKTIIVEDFLAKEILDVIIESSGNKALVNLLDVKYYPGGETIIKKEFMPIYSRDHSNNHFIVFDGDMKTEKVDVNDLSEKEKTSSNLSSIISKIVDQNIKFSTDSGDNQTKEMQKVSLMLDYIRYHHDNVFFLPKDIPEEIIWDKDICYQYIIDEEQRSKINSILKTLTDTNKTKIYKEVYNEIAFMIFGDRKKESQNAVYKIFINCWKQNKNDSYNSILDIITKIKNK